MLSMWARLCFYRCVVACYMFNCNSVQLAVAICYDGTSAIIHFTNSTSCSSGLHTIYLFNLICYVCLPRSLKLFSTQQIVQHHMGHSFVQQKRANSSFLTL
uniref:Secreted protein n=1 Tax=Rhipicephalus zambeziensis TaxID=60191 RepID=A0A224Y793_9ACAR